MVVLHTYPSELIKKRPKCADILCIRQFQHLRFLLVLDWYQVNPFNVPRNIYGDDSHVVVPNRTFIKRDLFV